jgi:hypothetical protein
MVAIRRTSNIWRLVSVLANSQPGSFGGAKRNDEVVNRWGGPQRVSENVSHWRPNWPAAPLSSNPYLIVGDCSWFFIFITSSWLLHDFFECLLLG